jgi:hypothetical protein
MTQQLQELLNLKALGDAVRIEAWLGSVLTTALGSKVDVEWLTPADGG